MNSFSAGGLLAQRPTVTASGADEACSMVSELLDDHRLRALEREDVRLRMRTACEGVVGLIYLEYGAPVEIASSGLDYFHLVQIPLRGQSSIRAHGCESGASSVVATLPPLDEDFVQRWERDSPHLLVYVEHGELVRVAEQTEWRGDVSRLPVTIPLDTQRGKGFLRAVDELHATIDKPSQSSDFLRSLVSDLVVARLLEATDAEPEEALERSSSRGENLFRRFRDLAEEADAQSSVVELASQLRVSLRTLQDHVRSASGMTPTALLREVRMNRAHRMLVERDQSTTTVTMVAEDCGFTHLGRFSIEYRRRFGRGPAQTLREVR